jgi:hypothetical protein
MSVIIPVVINGRTYRTSVDGNGIQRFVPNAIVHDFVVGSLAGKTGEWTLNSVSYEVDNPYSLDDLVEFGALHGYSVAGLCDLSFMEGVVVENPLWGVN